MEDDNGLELSLGLSCGGSNAKLKGKDSVASSDVKIEEGENTNNNKSLSDLKNFLNSTMQKHDNEDVSQRNDVAQSGQQTLKENFFTNLAKSSPDASGDLHVGSGSQFTRFGEPWVSNNKSPEVEEIKFDQSGNGGKVWLEAGNKRKMLFEELNRQKKHERENEYSDANGNMSPMVSTSMKASHVSVTTEEGSTAENEDVAESEVEGSTSRLVLSREDSIKHYSGSGRGSSEISKERFGQMQSNASPGNDGRVGNVTYGNSLPPMTMQYSLSSKMSRVNGEPNTSGFPSSRMMQLIPPASNEGPGSQAINSGNLPLTFGYSPVQLPTLTSERSWGLTTHSGQLPSSYAGRNIGSGVSSLDRAEDGLNTSRGVVQAPHSSSEASPDERKASELTKGVGKQHAPEEGGTSSVATEDEMKVNRTKEYHVQPVESSLSGSAIRPGIAPGLKFGGCGSYPDLPWVSTKGPGPNGRTISGVTYRYDKNQIKIVCACHGCHMSPEEFVQHAGADQPNPENNTGLASLPNGNSAASAQS